jgi:hypothetical protein
MTTKQLLHQAIDQLNKTQVRKVLRVVEVIHGSRSKHR